MQVYSQLRVSCGLSATINATQPEALRISSKESFAHWMDVQWLKLTHNEDPADSLVKLCTQREWKWAAVLDFILLRKISSSFLLCQGIAPGVLMTEVEAENLNWTTLKPAFLKILTRLNERTEDWPLWHYEGTLKNPEKGLDEVQFRKDAVILVQSIKVFYEIYSSNLSAGPEADWKRAIDNIVGFPQRVSSDSVYTHLDYYKTDFELSGLLQTLGYILDSTYGRTYPKSVIPNSVILINRPEHWVTEDWKSRGTVLDSLTQGTDAVHVTDSFNYFRPIENLRILKSILPKLADLFPKVEIALEEEEFTEFPELVLPTTTNPDKTAIEYHQKAAASIAKGDLKAAALDKRIEVALLEKMPPNPHYITNMLEFTDLCLQLEKSATAQENIGKLEPLVQALDGKQTNLKLRYSQLAAKLASANGDMQTATACLAEALKYTENTTNYEQAYDIAHSLGITYAKAKMNSEALGAFKQALKWSQAASKVIKLPDPNTPRKYWPALIRGVNKKIALLEKLLTSTPTPAVDAVKKVE